ncbi:MAG: tRNA (adenosine(37)-N6)-threonylcarbamoyltransferase complex dimerization subunit type 1 TsaB [Oxalobacter sp.]|nr:tRNA (adenosine(37)-N6)-threonylcarbamoyltransferase complex dimerization subunit type 1 TsaB [Oxalobacter sp.]
MPTIISIDTSSDTASVALLHRGQLHSALHEGFSTHSMTVLPMLQSLLEAEGLALADCDAIAFGCGPGSFTGLRTACGIVQGMAFGLDLPVIPVTTLEAMAESCRRKTGAGHVLPLLDARMHEVYWAEYAYQDGKWQAVTEPQLSAVSEIHPKHADVTFCGNGLTAYPDGLETVVGDSPQVPDVFPDAESVAVLAEGLFKQGKTVPVEKVEPLYLRNKVALKTVERMALKEKEHA